ncbi:MAG: SH3 domain-containing protein [Promethearchaeota archaeon]
MIKKDCRVVKNHTASFSVPLILKKGEKLRLETKDSEWPGWIWVINKSKKSGWVPKSYLKIHGNNAIMLKDYDATELTVSIGEEFLIELEESGWIWVTSENGKSGWIPLENIEKIE